MNDSICTNVCAARDATELEAAVAALPLFRAEKLRMFCGVPLAELEHFSGEGIPDDMAALRAELVICKGESVLIAVEYTGDEPGIGAIRRLPVQSLPARCTPAGGARRIGRALELAVTNLKGGAPNRWYFGPVPLPPALYAPLRRERMLAQEFCEFNGRLAEQPTVYGAANGILRGYRTEKKGGVYCLPYCGRDSLARLSAAASENKTAPKRRAAPFAERLRRIDQGLPCSDAVAAAAVRDFAARPLGEYLEGFEDELERLNTDLDYPPTYADAAERIYRMAQVQATRARGLELTRLLAAPLAGEFEKARFLL